MDHVTLAASTVAALTPYLAKAAEKGVEKLGELAAEKSVGGLYAWLKEKLAGKPVAEALEDMSANPADADVQATLRTQLRKALEQDPVLASELQACLPEVSQNLGVSGDSNVNILLAGNGNQINL